MEREIRTIDTKLAGTVRCPKCAHEFFIDASESPEELRVRQAACTKDIESRRDTNEKYGESYARGERIFEDLKKEVYSFTDKKHEELSAYRKVQQAASGIGTEIANMSKRLAELKSSIVRTGNAIEKLRYDMFKEAFNILDEQQETVRKAVRELELNVEKEEYAIKTNENNIENANKPGTNNTETIIKQLEESLDNAVTERIETIRYKEDLSAALNKLKVQENEFTKFKTFLANSKIKAVEDITNEFLAVIGSDMRVVLSGYTVLKSGKVRDKISVSLLRDGVDCGVFQKLSRGEQARIQLANILAMYKLTNMKCAAGEGLDLLVIDEVLDSSDESGLTAVFNALNDMNITSLIVSHGNIAENYEYRLVVRKQSGESTLIY